MLDEFSIYIHYPFCLSKCPYCDFNSYVMSSLDEEKLLEAYLRELEYYYNYTEDRKVKTIFFGGGTPSLMKPKFLEAILKKINKLWGIGEIEISMEANPTSVELQKFRDFRLLGINRLSLGVQALDDEQLKYLGRTHSRAEAVAAVKLAASIFDNYSIDMIYARAGQTISSWQKELEEAAELSPKHLSLYQLIIEEGTVFARRGVKPLEDDLAADMYNFTKDYLSVKGLNLYEVSNYSAVGYECRHNLNYWQSGEWIGIGAGAHGRLCLEKRGDYRVRKAIANWNKPKRWLENMLNSCVPNDFRPLGAEEVENLSKEEFLEEVLLMGLRLKNGVKLENIKNYLNLKNMEEALSNVAVLKSKNYIEISKNSIKVNTKYFSILDSIIERLVK